MYHVGGLRTALFSYLYAKKHAGDFLVRVEDTDRERYVEGSIENMVESLIWAGIPADEGVTYDSSKTLTQIGDSGPYIQSERLDIYKTYSQQLIAQKNAFYCFCTRERLDDLRKNQELSKQPTGYDGHCKSLDEEEIKSKLASDTPYVVRLNMPDTGETAWTDLVRGKVTFDNALIDDQVLMKTDGFPTYHFAVVVDDHLMEISHVLRGEEWLSSTPKHIVLYTMFGWDIPTYGHLSLLVNEQKQKLSKRHGDVSVSDFRAKGYLPEALVNFVAFLGWNPGTEQEIFTLPELIEVFDFSKVNKASAVFNYEKLDWYNREWMKRLPIEELADRARPYFEKAGMDTSSWNLVDLVTLGRERATTLADIPQNVRFLLEEPSYDPSLLVWKKADTSDAKEMLIQLLQLLESQTESDWTGQGIEDAVMLWIKEHAYGVGNVLWPARVALSGLQNSPGPFDIMRVLGRDKTCDRIATAIEKLQ